MFNLLLISKLAWEVSLPALTQPLLGPSLPGLPQSFHFSSRVLSLNYSSSTLPSLLRDTRCCKSLAVSMCPSPPRCLSNCTFTHSSKLLLRCWLAEGLIFVICILTTVHLLSTMAAEKMAFNLIETASTENQEGDERPPYSPQLLGRKLLWMANGELAGW